MFKHFQLFMSRRFILLSTQQIIVNNSFNLIAVLKDITRFKAATRTSKADFIGVVLHPRIALRTMSHQILYVPLLIIALFPIPRPFPLAETILSILQKVKLAGFLFPDLRDDPKNKNAYRNSKQKPSNANLKIEKSGYQIPCKADDILQRCEEFFFLNPIPDPRQNQKYNTSANSNNPRIQKKLLYSSLIKHAHRSPSLYSRAGTP